MKNENITIPILVEGFNNIMFDVLQGPKNFDCFKDFISSLLTTQSEFLRKFDHELFFEKSYVRFIQDTSKAINKTFSFTQRQILRISLELDRMTTDNGVVCDCALHYDCWIGQFKAPRLIERYNWLAQTNIHKNMVEAKILDPKFPTKGSKFGLYCRISRLRRQYYEDILMQTKKFHFNECNSNIAHRRCWQGEGFVQ